MVWQKHEKGGYYYRFFKDGKKYYGVCEGCTTKRAAEIYEKKIKDTVAEAVGTKSAQELIIHFRDELTGGHRITLTEAFALYVKKPTKRKASERQIACNRTYWNDFVMFVTMKYPEITTIASVTRPMAEEYISYIRMEGAFNKTIAGNNRSRSYSTTTDKLSPRTINARHKAVKAVFARLKEDAGLLNNPFDIPTLDNETTSREAFTDDELKRIGENMTMPYIRPVFTIGLCTGLTLGDICLLKWSEISGNWITDKRRRKTGVALEIPILPPLAAFLDEQSARTGNDEYVSPELAKMYQENPSGVFYRIKEFLESIGIKTTAQIEGRSRAVSTKAAHAMRHTFAYLAGVYNIPQPIVQGVLGHMSPEMTALYQRHAQREQKEKFFKQMPNVLGVSTATAHTALMNITKEPERTELHRLADTLPIETIRTVLAMIKSEK